MKMAKFYVESGDIKTVISAKNEFSACMKCLDIEGKKFRNVKLESNFFVSEKGFLSERDSIQITIPEEKVLDTEIVINRYNNLGR